MRQSKPSLLLPLLNRIDWHNMTSPLAESADTWSRTFSSEIPVSVAISESSRSPRSFRYFRISCKADTPSFLFQGCVGTRKRSRILRRTDRSLRPRLRRNHFTQHRPTGARREPGGRGRGHRLRRGGQIACRRLHAALHHLDADRAGPGLVQKTAL